MGELTELEGVVLGIVGKNQPCTAYAVRRELRESPSTFWKASAGSVYPLCRRLESDGLVKSVEDSTDGRGRRLLRMTKKGRDALIFWVGGAADPEVAASVYDPVRSRIFFWDVLPRREQLLLAHRTLAVLEEYWDDTRGVLADGESGFFERAGGLGAETQARSRVMWMRRTIKQIKKAKSAPK